MKIRQEVLEWTKKNDELMKRPDVFNSVTVLLRSFAAFPFQEIYGLDPKIIKLLNFIISTMDSEDNEVTHFKLEKGLQLFNKNLDRFSTFAPIEPFNAKDVCLGGKPTNITMELFPGSSQCQSKYGTRHSIWHAQSARALIDMFKFVDEFIGKRKEFNMNDNVFDNIASTAVKEIEKTLLRNINTYIISNIFAQQLNYFAINQNFFEILVSELSSM